MTFTGPVEGLESVFEHQGMGKPEYKTIEEMEEIRKKHNPS